MMSIGDRIVWYRPDRATSRPGRWSRPARRRTSWRSVTSAMAACIRPASAADVRLERLGEVRGRLDPGVHRRDVVALRVRRDLVDQSGERRDADRRTRSPQIVRLRSGRRAVEQVRERLVDEAAGQREPPAVGTTVTQRGQLGVLRFLGRGREALRHRRGWRVAIGSPSRMRRQQLFHADGEVRRVGGPSEPADIQELELAVGDCTGTGRCRGLP